MLLALAARSACAADCNGDGRPDAEEIAAGDARDCNLNGIPDECEGEQRVFEFEQEFDVLGTPRALAVGDFEGDGGLQFVIATKVAREEHVAVFPLRGAAPEVVSYPAGDRTIRQLVVGDFNRDGSLDVATMSRGEVFVVPGEGGGAFSEPRQVVEGGSLHDIGVRDLDGDGNLDLAVADRNRGEVLILLGEGDGTFRPPERRRVGEEPRSLALGDVDGNGLVDVVTANDESDDLSILLNAGDGTFRPARPLVIPRRKSPTT